MAYAYVTKLGMGNYRMDIFNDDGTQQKIVTTSMRYARGWCKFNRVELRKKPKAEKRS